MSARAPLAGTTGAGGTRRLCLGTLPWAAARAGGGTGTVGGGTGTAGGVTGTAGAGTGTAGVWATAGVITGAVNRRRRGAGRMGDTSAPDTVLFKVSSSRPFLGLELLTTTTLFLKRKNGG